MAIKRSDLEQLAARVGRENVLTSEADRVVYSTDMGAPPAIVDLLVKRLADAVVRCHSIEDVETTVNFCLKRRIPMTPRAAATTSTTISPGCGPWVVSSRYVVPTRGSPGDVCRTCLNMVPFLGIHSLCPSMSATRANTWLIGAGIIRSSTNSIVVMRASPDCSCRVATPAT